MSLLIISDIHGCKNNLLTALANPHEFDEIILLGDFLNHGPRNPILPDYDPIGVSEILNNIHNPIAVRGNCDSEVDQMLLNFNMFEDFKLIQRYNKEIFITHGHIYEPEQDGSKLHYDIFISGHTHLPYINKNDYGITFNPGSISMPKENHPPTYAILNKEGIIIYTLDHKPYISHTF